MIDKRGVAATSLVKVENSLEAEDELSMNDLMDAMSQSNTVAHPQ
jgi:hypothetical protein